MRRWLIIAGVLAAILVGFVFLRGPVPAISVKPEALSDVGGPSSPYLHFYITNSMLTSWFVVIFLVIFVFAATRRWNLVPSGLQNLIEGVAEAFYNLVVNIAGEKNGRRFFPVVATIFFFVLAANWLSLLPLFGTVGKIDEGEAGFVFNSTSVGSMDVGYVGFSGPGHLKGESIDEKDADAAQQHQKAIADGKTVGDLLPFLRAPAADLNTPLALAIVSFIFVEFWGVSTLGLFAYGGKFVRFGKFFKGLFSFNFGLLFEGVIDIFVGFLEMISELVRLISFTFRLFGNVFAGEVVILMFTFLVPIVLTVVFYGLELFVGVIQAFIFATLTLVFGVMAVSEHAEHDSHAGEEHHPEEIKSESGLEAAPQQA